MVLKRFYSLSRRTMFVGGKCALPSDFLVIQVFVYRQAVVSMSLKINV